MGPTLLTDLDLPCHWMRLDAQGRLLQCDPPFARRLGSRGVTAATDVEDVKDDAFMALPLTHWLSPSSAVLWSAFVLPAVRERGRVDEAVLVFEFDGLELPLAAQLQWAGTDAAASITAVLTPAGERLRLQSELRQVRRSLEAMPGAVIQCQHLPTGGLAFPYASERLLDLFAVTASQAASDPQRLLAALVPTTRVALETGLLQAHARGDLAFRTVLRAQRTPNRAIELQAQWSAADAVWQGVLTDVTEREMLQLELRRQSQTDALTRLPNRSGLIEHLQGCLSDQRPVALLFMDCDRFKQVNDSLGHEAGDDLLRELAQRLRHVLREPAPVAGGGVEAGTSRAARLGGDEFVVVARGLADRVAVAELADRLIDALSQPYRIQGLDVVTGVSIGIVLAAADSTTAQMLRDADTAMYEAKRNHRGRWVLFESAMHQRVSAAMSLEAELREALRVGQLRPVFQPIIEIASGRVVGMEALARWRHPQRGEISPLEFIPVAEESGLITEVGETMLRLACRAFVAWRQRQLEVPARLSVNLSRAQLTDRGLPARIARILDEVGLPASALQLEVTESLAMADDAVRLVLLSLREQGIQLALDDFGTGHSSLASLQTFPVQQLKIDRSFVREIESSAYHRALIQAALQVATALNLEVVAEGVETASQAQLLAELGCPRAQGFLYARPLEIPDVPAFLAQAGQAVALR
jgi:diguanylate cyclase (GGDEF)-like protein